MSKIKNIMVRQIAIFDLSEERYINDFLLQYPDAKCIFVDSKKIIYEYETEFEVKK